MINAPFLAIFIQMTMVTAMTMAMVMDITCRPVMDTVMDMVKFYSHK